MLLGNTVTLLFSAAHLRRILANTPSITMRYGVTFRLRRTRRLRVRSSASETLSRIRSLADYTIVTRESEFSETTLAPATPTREGAPVRSSHRGRVHSYQLCCFVLRLGYTSKRLITAIARRRAYRLDAFALLAHFELVAVEVEHEQSNP